MALKQPLMIFSIIVALLSGTALIYEVEQWNQIRHYNNALDENNFHEAGDQFKGSQGLFAKAYAKQQQGQFQEARVIYTELENNKDDLSLRTSAMFNLANTYFQQALAEDLEKNADRAMPLVELAKSNYRKLLKLDSKHWDAKFNLERTLQTLPDVTNYLDHELEGDQGATRTVLSADTEENLP